MSSPTVLLWLFNFRLSTSSCAFPEWCLRRKIIIVPKTAGGLTNDHSWHGGSCQVTEESQWWWWRWIFPESSRLQLWYSISSKRLLRESFPHQLLATTTIIRLSFKLPSVIFPNGTAAAANKSWAGKAGRSVENIPVRWLCANVSWTPMNSPWDPSHLPWVYGNKSQQR